MTKSQLIFVYRCSLLCPFNTMVERIYPTNSSRQKNRQTEIYGSVQCRCTQCRPVEALVEFVESDDTTVSGFHRGLSSIGHVAHQAFILLVEPFRNRCGFVSYEIVIFL